MLYGFLIMCAEAGRYSVFSYFRVVIIYFERIGSCFSDFHAMIFSFLREYNFFRREVPVRRICAGAEDRIKADFIFFSISRR